MRILHPGDLKQGAHFLLLFHSRSRINAFTVTHITVLDWYATCRVFSISQYKIDTSRFNDVLFEAYAFVNMRPIGTSSGLPQTLFETE